MSWVRRLRLRVALVAALATGAALLLQNLLRQVWQVRTLPERVMEWLLLFVPLDLFEQGLDRFGANAKDLALVGTFVGMALVLIALGALALDRGWPSGRLLGLGLGLWLFSMCVVLPVTGAGLFGTALLVSPLLTSAGYLLVFLAYATVLVAGHELLPRSRVPLQPLPRRSGEGLYPGEWGLTPAQAPTALHRRALIAGLLGSLAAYGITLYAGRQGGLAASTLPLASLPTPTPAPATPTAASAPTAPPQSAATPPPAAIPTLEPLPNPPPSRTLTRDQDGALTAAGRPPGQLAPPITSNDNFYVVTKNAVADPNVDVSTWRLIVDGEVNQPVQLDYRTLRALPAVELTKTLECISNFTAGCNLTSFGCDLISTAHWKGARLSDVLALAGGLKPGVVGLAFISIDEFSAALPVDVASDPDCLIVYEMNRQPLPREHGFPARLLVPGRYGMKNPKWLATIRPMLADYAGYYEQRGWNKDGIVKTMARIDVPVDGAKLAPGPQPIAGIAYAGDRGIQKVEVSADDSETWQTADLLEPMPGRDAMLRWQGTFRLAPGATATLVVRATDGTGEVQTDAFSLPPPDGGSGRDSISVQAA